MLENLWLVGFQAHISSNMFIRVTSENILSVLEKHPKALWLLHPEKIHDFFHIVPSWQANSKLSQLEELYPDVVFLESVVTEELDYLAELGFTNEMIWSKHHFRAFMVSLKDFEVVDHSIGRCHCEETLIEMVVDLYPELFEPPSVS